MRQILIAVGIALTVSILLTPVLIRLFTRQGFGHEIREDGPPSHHKKRGTPSMAGVGIASARSTAVNLTDGVEGLAAGAMAMVCAAYVLITFWQLRNACANSPGLGCYNVRDPLDLAIIAAATAGACIGFLWWNAAPARIFMGDTGSLALGGIIAGLSVASRPEMLAVVLGALFVAEVTSVGVQIMAFRTTGRRVFRMAPFHHHFELVGWAETTVIIRFWLLTAIACGLGVALFYSEWLAAVGA